MSSIFFKATLLSFTALAVVGSGFSVKAETTDSLTADEITPLPTQIAEIPEAQIQSEQATNSVEKAESTLDRTTLTSAAALMAEPEVVTAALEQAQTPEASSETNAPVVAQVIAPGRATRSGPSYIGVGANIGVSGRSALGRRNFTVMSKLGLTNNFSVRPSAVIGNRTVFMVPITFDYPIEQLAIAEGFSVAPYIGGGVAISTGRDSRVGALISGGLDVPVTPNITATAGVNVGFLRTTDVGVLLGVGYAF